MGAGAVIAPVVTFGILLLITTACAVMLIWASRRGRMNVGITIRTPVGTLKIVVERPDDTPQ